MDSGICAIFNTVANKMYIGKSTQLSRRWRGHLKDLRGGRHHNRYLQASWDKYGKDAFIFGQLEEISPDNTILLGQRESYWVTAFQSMSRHKGYNLAIVVPDGTAQASDETRARQRASHLGKKQAPESIAKTAAAHRGKKRSAQTIARLRAANTGQLMTQEQKDKLREAKTGKPLSEEHKSKLSSLLANRKNTLTDEDRYDIACRSSSGENRRFLAEEYGIRENYVSTMKRGVMIDRKNGRLLILIRGNITCVYPKNPDNLPAFYFDVLRVIETLGRPVACLDEVSMSILKWDGVIRTASDRHKKRRFGIQDLPDVEPSTIAEKCRKLGVPYAMVYKRLRKGWSEEQAFSTPRDPRRQLAAAIEAQGGTMKDSAGKSLTYLIALDPHGNSGKLAAARKNGTQVISIDDAKALAGI